MHKLLEAHYQGKNWKKVHKELTKTFNSYFEEEREELGNLPKICKRLMLSYLRTYQKEDGHWTVVATELDKWVTLPNGLKLQVIIDLIVSDHMGLWIVDHKFRAKFSGRNGMVLDPQLTLYFQALEILGYRNIMGVIYNEVRTKAPTVPKLTAKTGRLEKRSNIDTDIWTYAAAVKAHGFDLADYADILKIIANRQHEKFFRRTHLPKDKPMVDTMTLELTQTADEIKRAEKRNAFPRTFLPMCEWGCDYRDLCISELHGGDISSMVNSGYTIKKGKEKDKEDPKWTQKS